MATRLPHLHKMHLTSTRPRLFSPSLLRSTKDSPARIRGFSLAAAAPVLALSFPLSLPQSIPSIPSLLADIWDSILRAVPKKKTSHMKRRHRQMAGKALKDVTALVKCPACGQTKRMHYLCPHCTLKLQHMMRDQPRTEGPS